MIRLAVASILTFGLLAFGAGVASAQTGEATEKILNDAKLEFTKMKDKPVFKVIIETDNGPVVVGIQEQKAPWKDSKKNDVLYAYIYTEVLRTPADFKPPAAMLTKLATVNDNLRFGSLGLSKNQDNTYSLYRNSSMFLKNTDGEQLRDMIFEVVIGKLAFQKEFRGFLELDK